MIKSINVGKGRFLKEFSLVLSIRLKRKVYQEQRGLCALLDGEMTLVAAHICAYISWA